jgi:hypothetical protein
LASTIPSQLCAAGQRPHVASQTGYLDADADAALHTGRHGTVCDDDESRA